jgi:hypothetical protein
MRKSRIFLIAVAAAGYVGWAVGLAVAAETNPRKNFVGPNQCTECHDQEAKAWQETHHFKTFKEMHRSKEAKAISKKMGIKRIKNDMTCTQCHYTTVGGGKKPIAGISCESCHGGAKNWIEVHNDYGGKTVKKEQESEAHKKKRIADAVAGGMIRPENIYHVARNCYQCHTVPNERLVNIGGHKAGSDFELVSWSQGEVRHNFLSGAGSNKPATPERKRVLYVAGRVLDLEYGLRGLAEASKAGEFADKMSSRVKEALGHVKKISDVVKSAEMGKIVAAAAGAQIKPGNGAALKKAADSISDVAEKYFNGNDGKNLAAVDSLIPSTTKGEAVQ